MQCFYYLFLWHAFNLTNWCFVLLPACDWLINKIDCTCGALQSSCRPISSWLGRYLSNTPEQVTAERGLEEHGEEADQERGEKGAEMQQWRHNGTDSKEMGGRSNCDRGRAWAMTEQQHKGSGRAASSASLCEYSIGFSTCTGCLFTLFSSLDPDLLTEYSLQLRETGICETWLPIHPAASGWLVLFVQVPSF